MGHSIIQSIFLVAEVDDSIVQIIFLVAVGLFVLIGTLVKKWQESRQRALDERRKLERRTQIAPPVAPAPLPVSYEDREREEPEDQESGGDSSRQVVLSPLEEFRRFVQDQQRRTMPSASPVPPPVPRPVRRLVTVAESARPEGEEGPSGKTLAETFAAKDVAAAAQDAVTDARQAQLIPPVAVESAPKPSLLAEVLYSDRSDLTKTVLLREILGPPLALRKSPLPYRRA